MFTEFLYTIVSGIYFVFSTFWLGILVLPLLAILAFNLVSDSEKDTLQKYSPEGVRPYVVLVQTLFVTIFFYGFIFGGVLTLKNSLFETLGRYELVELIEESVEKKENIYLDGKLLDPSSKLLDALVKVESRSRHRVKGGSVSEPQGDSKNIWIGTHTIRLYQDNGIAYEYWVYFDNYKHIGQIDTAHFIPKERYQALIAKKEAKELKRKEKTDNRKVSFVILFLFFFIYLVAYDALFKQNHFSSKQKYWMWNLYLVAIGGYIYYALISFLHFSSFSWVLIVAYLLYLMFTIRFCEVCGILYKRNCN